MKIFSLVEEDYKGFNIYWDGDRYHILDKNLEDLDITNYILNDCNQNKQCNTVSTIEKAKQFIDQPIFQEPTSITEEYQGDLHPHIA